MKGIVKGMVVLVLSALLCFAGCAKQGEAFQMELLEADKAAFVYENTEQVNQFAVDEDGLLYTFTYIPEEQSDEPQLYSEEENKAALQELCIYDLNGVCIEERELRLGNGTVNLVLSEGGLLYVVVSKMVEFDTVHAIYSINTDTWEIKELATIPSFSMINNLVHIGDYFYVLGILKSPEAKNFVLHPDVMLYSYDGEAVVRINTENGVMEQLQVDFPISIVGTNRNTVVVYEYSEEDGFRYTEFNPETVTMSVLGLKKTAGQDNFHRECEKGFLFTREARLYYGTADGLEAEVYSEDINIYRALYYRKGYAFFKDVAKTGEIERICIAEELRDNKVIHLLMHKDVQDKPYGCGYQMEKTILNSEEFALKVLAQDSDFDMYVLSSRDNASYNLMKNGAFYPLNEVEGVQEYLDACFPYVKEMATDENGDIWMLPVALSIPGLIYDKEYCMENGVDFSEMDFSEFLTFTSEMRKKHEKTFSLSGYVVFEELFGQYLCGQESFDTPTFRTYAEQVNELLKEDNWQFETEIMRNLLAGKPAKFFYMYNVYLTSLLQYAETIGEETQFGVTGVPKMTESIGNVGTITFLAVNPQSENLEATLDYITAFAMFMQTMQNSFMLADAETYTQTPFMMECYQLYANGEIRFAMDAEVYGTLFDDYLDGKIELEEMVLEMERRRKIYMEE